MSSRLVTSVIVAALIGMAPASAWAQLPVKKLTTKKTIATQKTSVIKTLKTVKTSTVNTRDPHGPR